MKLAIIVAACALLDCHESPSQVANQVVVGTEAAACILDVYAVDSAQGQSLPQTLADIVVQCAKYGVSEAQASSVVTAHRNAEVREGFVLKN